MDNEEITGVKFSQFPSATPGDSDEVVGLHAGDNARFSVANFILAIRQGLANIFVPLTRMINGKALNNDISLNASDVGAVATSAVGAVNGVASLDNAGKVPTSQLPSSTGPEPATATPLMDGTGAVGSSLKYAREDHEHPADTNKQDTIVASGILKGDGVGGVTAATAGTDYQAPLTAGTDYATPAQLADKANPGQIGYPESGTTASRNYSAGEYICWNGLTYTANQAISSGTTLSAATGGNLTECVGGGFNSIPKRTIVDTTTGGTGLAYLGNFAYIYSATSLHNYYYLDMYYKDAHGSWYGRFKAAGNDSVLQNTQVTVLLQTS